MTTIDKHADIPVALALEFEGRAADAGMTAEAFLKNLLNLSTYRGVATTELQRSIQADVEAGVTDRECAERRGCSPHYVIQVRNKLGLPPNK